MSAASVAIGPREEYLMSKMQRDKGKRWERAVASLLRAVFGDAVKRGWQTRSGSDAPDVDGTPFWVECKHGQQPNVRAALAQAVEAGSAAGDPRPPVAAVKDNNCRAMAVMFLEDWLDLVKEWNDRGK